MPMVQDVGGRGWIRSEVPSALRRLRGLVMAGSRLGAVVAATTSVAVASAFACGGVQDESLSGRSGAGGVIQGSGVDEGVNTTGRGAGTGAETGLPCDVQQLLENRCIGCHLRTSPPPLLTYDDLVKSKGGKSLAVASLERMKNAANPMPPSPASPPTAEEIATLEAWISAGTPRGASCTTGSGSPNAGGNPYGTPLVCTSGKMWTRGDDESHEMHPGRACITCHSIKGGPTYSVAGTVYPSAHEPNDCNGAVPSDTSVVVTDKNGVVTTVRVNAVGNFELKTRIAAPFRVKVTSGGKERAMNGSLTAGDCNTCHTQDGVNGAPGRIMAP